MCASLAIFSSSAACNTCTTISMSRTSELAKSLEGKQKEFVGRVIPLRLPCQALFAELELLEFMIYIINYIQVNSDCMQWSLARPKRPGQRGMQRQQQPVSGHCSSSGQGPTLP